MEACKLNEVNPQGHTDLLTRLAHGWPQARIDALMRPGLGHRKGHLTVKSSTSGWRSTAYG